MWQWCAEVKLGNPTMDAWELKVYWMTYIRKTSGILNFCYFCEYTRQTSYSNHLHCQYCPLPGSDECRCEVGEDTWEKPVQFYNRLLLANEARLKHKNRE
jgi:hypothetical protein